MIARDALSEPSAQSERARELVEFQAVFDAEFSYVCRTLRRLGVRDADLEDVAQEVFLAVHGKFETFDRGRPIRPWLFAFSLRAAMNHQRLARHRREVPGPTPIEPSSGETPEDALVKHQAQELVLAALDAVPLERRSVLIMHDIDGFGASEIAETLSIPINTVYSRARVARGEFKKALAREQRRRGEP